MNYFLVAISLLVLAVPAYANHTPHAAQHDAVIKVNGLVCDFCARTVEKLFNARAEVQGIDVDLDKHEIVIDFKDAQSIDDSIISKIITDAGYSLVEIIRS